MVEKEAASLGIDAVELRLVMVTFLAEMRASKYLTNI